MQPLSTPPSDLDTMSNQLPFGSVVEQIINGKLVLFDAEDLALFNCHRGHWYISSNGYIVDRQTSCLFHRMILGISLQPKGLRRNVKFINHNRLDCRRSNLFLKK